MKPNPHTITKEEIEKDPYGYTYAEFAAVLEEQIAKKMFASLYRRNADAKYHTLSIEKIYHGSDTDKYVYRLPDGKHIETVCIKRRDGATVCVSTQVGCPVGCMFCESGRHGLIRNLTASEIVQQVILLKQKINRIVYMGMGEPLYNYDNVIRSIHILRDRNGLNFPTDGITLSTVAPLEYVKRLREEHLKIQLTISLHAATQQVRNKIIPSMQKYAIRDVVDAGLSYAKRHNRRVVFAYLLLPGINDRPSDAYQLIQWFQGENMMINLLEYNKTSRKDLHKPTKQAMVTFKRLLEKGGLDVKMRVSHGDSVKGACGQLANHYNKDR